MIHLKFFITTGQDVFRRDSVIKRIMLKKMIDKQTNYHIHGDWKKNSGFVD